MKLLFTQVVAVIFLFVIFAAVGNTAQADPAPDLTSWKTIQIGNGPKNADEYGKALKDAGFEVNAPDSSLFRASSSQPVDLVKISSKDLGFPRGAGYKEIYAAAAKLGLHPCPADVGPQLRLVYTDQPAGEVLLIAMEPLLVRSEYSNKDEKTGVVTEGEIDNLKIFIVVNTGKAPSLEEGNCTPKSDTKKDDGTEVMILGWDPTEDHGNDVWVFAK